MANQPKSGAPLKADEAYWQRVEAVVEQEPHGFGYAFTVWTAERLVAHMAAETGIELSVSHFQTIMRQRGYVYRRPKHDLGNLQDPDARTAAETWLDELKKALAGDFHLFFVDEMTLGLHPVLTACWMKRGTQLRIPTPGKQQWHHLFGTYNFVTDEVVTMAAPKKKSNAFVAFLDTLVQQVDGDRPIMIVLDNASYHRSRAAHAGFAALEARLMPLFLPAYCSTLNPIERYWRHLKGLTCANRLFPSMQKLVDSIQIHLRQQNDPLNLKRFTIRKNLPTST